MRNKGILLTPLDDVFSISTSEKEHSEGSHRLKARRPGRKCKGCGKVMTIYQKEAICFSCQRMKREVFCVADFTDCGLKCVLTAKKESSYVASARLKKILTRAYLIRERIEKGLKIKQIALNNNCSTSVVFNALKEKNIYSKGKNRIKYGRV